MVQCLCLFNENYLLRLFVCLHTFTVNSWTSWSFAFVCLFECISSLMFPVWYSLHRLVRIQRGWSRSEFPNDCERNSKGFRILHVYSGEQHWLYPGYSDYPHHRWVLHTGGFSFSLYHSLFDPLSRPLSLSLSLSVVLSLCFGLTHPLSVGLSLCV